VLIEKRMVLLEFLVQENDESLHKRLRLIIQLQMVGEGVESLLIRMGIVLRVEDGKVNVDEEDDDDDDIEEPS
jgi:hypothetical protein